MGRKTGKNKNKIHMFRVLPSVGIHISEEKQVIRKQTCRDTSDVLSPGFWCEHVSF